MERQGKDGNNSLENIREEELAVLIDKVKLPEELTMLIDKAKFPEEFVEKEYSIFRVPQEIRQINEAVYTPHVVSIGPYHKGNKMLRLMEPFKLGYFKSFLRRTGLKLENCISKLKDCEPRIRNCYQESISLDSDTFLSHILIDAGFIIELFIRYHDEGSSVFPKLRLLVDVSEDLILLENQLPFFVLEDLFNLAPAGVAADLPTFLHLAFGYFEELNPQELRPDDVIGVRDFTDLLRIFYLPPRERLPERSRRGNILEHLYNARELVEAGLKFKVDESKKCLLELHYEKGVLTMPRLDISSTIELQMRNIVAFEQGYCVDEAYITDYLNILDFLIDTEKDVEILVHKGVITNSSGDNYAVATMINRLCSKLIQPNVNVEYLSIGKQLNEFYDWPINKWKAGMIHDYCDTPVKIATSIAAMVLLILTAIQTGCALIPLAR